MYRPSYQGTLVHLLEINEFNEYHNIHLYALKANTIKNKYRIVPFQGGLA